MIQNFSYGNTSQFDELTESTRSELAHQGQITLASSRQRWTLHNTEREVEF